MYLHSFHIGVAANHSETELQYIHVKTILPRFPQTRTSFRNPFKNDNCWGEPERAPHLSNGFPRDLYNYVYIMYRTSFRKCPRVLIHWTASFDFAMRNQFRKCHHIQIIETTILYLQWATTRHEHVYVASTAWSSCESANYSYSELSYVSAKLCRSSVD